MPTRPGRRSARAVAGALITVAVAASPVAAHVGVECKGLLADRRGHAVRAAMQRRLKLALRTEDGRVVALSLDGAVDAYAGRDLGAIIVFAELNPGLVIDLSEVTSIDDVGLDHLEHAAELGARFQNVSPAVVRLLEARGDPEVLPLTCADS